MEMCYMSLDQLLRDGLEAASCVRIEVIPSQNGFYGYTWRMQVPGRGVYSGCVDQCWNDETGDHLAFWDANKFEAEN